MTQVSDKPNIILEPNFFPQHTALFEELAQVVTWDESMRARKTASFGKPYDYSQMAYESEELPSCLLPIRNLLKERLSVSFNNCLLNLYETGQNTMGFHSDETKNLLPETGVAIVSLGSERMITFRSMDQTVLVDHSLAPGSLLYMGGDVQDDWMHSIRKQEITEPRISLTWRAIR